MKKIIIRIFAAIGVMVTIFGLFIGFSIWHWFTQPAPATKAPENIVLDLDFNYPIVEQVRGLSFSLPSLLSEEIEVPLTYIIRALDRAKDDPKVKGVVARLGSVQPSLVHSQEIRAALKRFRESGKFTYVFASNYGEFGNGNRSYYLASAFENIWLQPVGTVGLSDIGVEAPFGKTALDKLGVSTDFVRREEYKSVMENVTRDDFSPPVRANMESMLKNLADQQAVGIAESRKIDLNKIRQFMADGPYTSSEAMKHGLVTHIGYGDDMLKEVKEKSGKDPERMDVYSYLSVSKIKDEPKATVALINGLGMIVDSPLSGPSRFSGDYVINANDLAKDFSDAAEDEDVKAILFRIDSPGGSPSASETIRHALVKAKEAKKPVFVSMGSVAASGGYWIAMNADHIVAEPSTITGSIGVVAGKFVLGGLWEKLGIKWDSIVTGSNANMWSSNAPFSNHGRERMNALVDDTYKSFVENVSAARKIPLDKMQDVAKGRVWTGEQAIKVGLVDELGGMETTISAIKKHLKLEPKDVIEIRQFPPPETPTTFAIKILKNLGFEVAAFRGVMSSIGNLQNVLGPLLREIGSMGKISAKVPQDFIEAVR